MEMLENLGWGDTVYNRIFAVIQDFATRRSTASRTRSRLRPGRPEDEGPRRGDRREGLDDHHQR
jgi:hypothetical protein